MSRMLTLTDPNAMDASRSGGKGASLARAAQHLPVPPGAVIDAAVYRDFVAPLRARIGDVLADSALDHAGKSERIRTLLLAQTWPA